MKREDEKAELERLAKIAEKIKAASDEIVKPGICFVFMRGVKDQNSCRSMLRQCSEHFDRSGYTYVDTQGRELVWRISTTEDEFNQIQTKMSGTLIGAAMTDDFEDIAIGFIPFVRFSINAQLETIEQCMLKLFKVSGVKPQDMQEINNIENSLVAMCTRLEL